MAARRIINIMLHTRLSALFVNGRGEVVPLVDRPLGGAGPLVDGGAGPVEDVPPSELVEGLFGEVVPVDVEVGLLGELLVVPVVLVDPVVVGQPAGHVKLFGKSWISSKYTEPWFPLSIYLK